MTLEQLIFRNAQPNFERLSAYGFSQQNDVYHYSQNIMNGSFRADLSISKTGEIYGKVFDLETGDEYANVHISTQQGAFVNSVREAYCEVLEAIRDNCFDRELFSLPQANRLVRHILSSYGDKPDFPWEKYTDYAVFRHPSTQKWYALVMALDKSKIGAGKGETEVVNLKTDHATELQSENGIYPAYHMNKNSWISLILDDSIADERLWKLLDDSHQFAMQGKVKNGRKERINEWLVPANPKYYDVEKAFLENQQVTWKQSTHIAVGDIVYMYVGAPRSAVMYRCEVLETDIPYKRKHPHITINKLMKLQLLQCYDPQLFPFAKLKEFGVNAVRGPRNMPKALSEHILATVKRHY